jgi:formate/nitrite transporter FocA (FNT family)
MKETLKIIPSAILAGICIAIGGTVFATIGGLAGAVLFSFGLLAVVHYGLHLYTGKAGFFCSWKGIFQLLTVILFGNVLGCYLTGLIAQPNVVDVSEYRICSSFCRLSEQLLACNSLRIHYDDGSRVRT